MVFKEGEPVEYLAIVKSGEYQVTKRVPKAVTEENELETMISQMKHRQNNG